MAAGAWVIYAEAKRKIGEATMDLEGGVFKMSLHQTAASATVTARSSISIWSSIGSEITAKGGYAVGGKALAPATGQWTVGISINQMKFTYTTSGLVFTANAATLEGIRYAVIRKSVGSTASGYPLCYAALSTVAFDIVSPNTLTILPAATGVFTLT